MFARTKGVKDGTDIYERKTDQAIGIIDGAANGNIHAGQFLIQYCRQLLCGKDQ